MEGTESAKAFNADTIKEVIAVACPEWRGLKGDTQIAVQQKQIKLQWLAPNGGD